jgi:hypothetical protein
VRGDDAGHRGGDIADTSVPADTAARTAELETATSSIDTNTTLSAPDGCSAGVSGRFTTTSVERRATSSWSFHVWNCRAVSDPMTRCTSVPGCSRWISRSVSTV